MLPTGMAEEGISLFQGRENLALTFAVRLRTEGERAGTVEEYRVTPSFLPHVHQCTYAQVDRILLAGASPTSPPQPFTQNGTGQQRVPLDQHAVFEGADGEVRQAAVRRLERLAEMRRKVRLAQGAVDMAIPRPKIKVTRSREREGEERDVAVSREHDDASPARRLVQEMMLAAGEAAASYAQGRKLAFLYRAQIADARVAPGKPESQGSVTQGGSDVFTQGGRDVMHATAAGGVQEGAGIARDAGERGRGGGYGEGLAAEALGPVIALHGLVTVQTGATVVTGVNGPVTGALGGDAYLAELCRQFQQLLLMKPAVTMPFAAPHGGLGLKAYSQVTSPIRRYPDLILHRQLKADLLREPAPYSHSDLLAMIPKIEQKTASIARLQRASERFWVLEYLRRQGLGAEYEGAVIRVLKHHDRRSRQVTGSVSILMTALGHIEQVRGLSAIGLPALGSIVRVRVSACNPQTGILSLLLVT